MKEKSDFYFVSDGTQYVEVKLNQEFNQQDEYGKRDYLCILTKSDAKDKSGDTFYRLGVYRKEDGFLIRWKENADEITRFLWKFENVQAISGDNLKLLPKGDE